MNRQGSKSERSIYQNKNHDEWTDIMKYDIDLYN